ncbi:histone-lysine N-methyltransferase SETMAR [Trichonephila clavipes]|nr:histone-lysine N-methyltransferase SETMAR [Trichonephila clavipes]
MITNFFIPELNNHDVQELWFQQDGATCHTARATIDLLKDTFGDRLISRFGPVNWLPRSCDLTPLDYFLCADKPQTLDHLEDNIRRVIVDIRPQMLGKVIENWTSRLDYIRASRERKKLTNVYGEGVLTIRQCQNWFAKFRSGNFDVEDAPRSGRPFEADKDAIKALVDANRRITTREIGLRLNLSNSTVYDDLKGLELSSKLDVWVPHVLTERNLCRRIDVCDSLLKCHENDPFLKRINTGDEKGHGAKKMNRLKPFPKPIFTKKKVYCHQLDKLNDALQQKRSGLINKKGVVFHEDNARPHTSLVTRQMLLQLEWDTMPHPPYSPDLAPSDYYLFRSLQNFLDGKTFTSNEEVKNHLDQFFASKDQKFYERGIMLLPEIWQKVLDQNGQYII